MKTLAAFVRSFYVDTFNRKQVAPFPALKTSRHHRFKLETLESRVLLSVDPGAIPPLIDQPEPEPMTMSQIVLLLSDSDLSGAGTSVVETNVEAEGSSLVDTLLSLDNDGPLIALTVSDEDSAIPADVLTNNNSGASGVANFTQSETTVVAFGSTVLVGFNDSGSSAGGINKGTGFSRSTDGGATFIDGGTLPTNAGGDGGDPVLAVNDATGRIYFSTLGPGVGTVQVFRSDDGGANWMTPVNGTPGGSSEDKEWITVDNFAGSGNGNVYLVSRRFGGTIPGIYLFRSTDHGATFGPTGGTLMVPGSQGAFVTVGPDHSVYVFWQATTGIQMRKSVDQGVTFGAPVTVAPFLAPGGVNGDLGLTGVRQGTATASAFRSNKFPHAAVNPVNGNIYITYNDDGPGIDKADVYVVQSTTGGATWGAPVKVNDDVTITDQWQPTLAVSPGGDRLGIFYSSRQEDPLGNNLFKYYGRIASISGSTLTFAPGFAVSDTASLPEFGRDLVVNPVYMGDYNMAYATSNAFVVSWSDNRDDLINGGGRKDPNVYYKSIDLGLAVRTTTPAIGSVVSTIPVNYVVNFSDAIMAATVDSTDFTVDGISADSFVVNSSTQVTFHFNSAPFSTQGQHTMAMAAGAILRASDADALGAFSGAFRYDAVLLQVTSTSPAVGSALMLPGPFTYDVNFNEAVNPASVQTWDLVLSGISGATVSAVTVLPGNTTVRFTLSGITEQGSLTASMMAGGITDTFGNPGAAFLGSYSVDILTAAYPTPLTAKVPPGSLIYDPAQTGFISFAGDLDSFTLNVDPNQTISLVLTPTSPGLRPRIELFDPNNVSQGFAIAPAAGQIAGIQTKLAEIGGVYTFAVTGVSGTMGGFTLQVILNSDFELEGKIAGITNDTLTSTMQTINAADSGFYAKLGTHSASDSSYSVGQLFGFGQVITEFRNYATFDLPATTPVILGAELRLFNPATGYSSPDPTETYSLFDVSATAASLDTERSGDLTGIAIFADLGSGVTYGSRVVSAADNNTTVAIPLNAAAITALNSAIGSTISFGGVLTTLTGTNATQTLFGGTSTLGQVRLVLQTEPVIIAQSIDSSFITVGTPQASAQRGAVLGQSELAGYSTVALPFTFEDISATGVVITPLTNQDNTSVTIPVGFTFPLYGVNNTTVSVASNGVLTFGIGGTTPLNTDLTAMPGQATIAPFWDDLHTGGGVSSSNVFFQVLGSGNNQHLTIQWNNVRFFSGGAAGDNITFQAQLYADGRIQFNYLDLVSGTAAGNNGASATVGVKAAGTQGPNRLLLAFNNGPNTFVGTGKSTLITPVSAPDYYAFTLNAGETATLAVTALTAGSLTVELRDSSDAVLATGTSGSTNLTSVIGNFAVAAGGTYYARISGAAGVPYSLVVTRNAAFDTEGNDSASTAQILDGNVGALGAIGGGETINAADSGWIATDGTHTAANNNYAVGQVLFNSNPLSQFRNYATFALSASTPTIIGAELRLFNPTSAYSSPDPTETYTLFDVSATAAALDTNRAAGDATGMAIHSDLGSGTVYGARVVSSADNNTTVAITLNADAVAALNAAIGSTISLGGAITSLAGTAMQSIFGFTSGAPGTVQLVLKTVADDWYSITLPGTANALRLETSTPGDGPGEFVNTLNPTIELYDNAGATLIAVGAAALDGRNESIIVTGLTPGATYKVRVSSESGTTGEYFLSRNFNFSPVLTTLSVASPINENDIATVNGTFSDLDVLDPHTVVITWGPGEGRTTLSLAAGVSTFSATHQYLDDNPTGTVQDVYSISVTVTDNHFGSGSGAVSLTVNNAAPVVAPVSGPASGVRGQALDFSGSFTDAGSLDTHEVRWDFGDGTVIDFHSTSDPSALTAPAHIYTDSGVYTLTLSIRDDDGGLTSVNKVVTITAVALQADPCDSGKTALVVGGTTANDSIIFGPQGSSGDIEVTINGISQGVFHPTGHLIAYGQAGDDDIQVSSSIGLDAWLSGDAGNDRLKGGAGASVLLGGDNDDHLNGGSGRSILIGGSGEDRLVGGSGEDILIGGFTAYDTNVLFLCTLLDGWKSTVDDYAARVARLRLLLSGSVVIDDGELDMLTGSSGLDWFFTGLGDVITVTKDGESIG